MRYRPFGHSAAAVSAFSLVLNDAPMRGEQRVRLIYAALEAGINTFEIQSRDPAVAAAVGEALSAVERRMVFVALRVGWARDRHGGRMRDYSAEGLTGVIEAVLARTGLGRLDVAIVDAPEAGDMPPHVIPSLQSARAAGRVRLLGIGGEDAVDPYLTTGHFDVLATPFNIQSGWVERNRLKRAVMADMAIIGSDFYPEALGGRDGKPSGPLGLGRLLAAPKKEKGDSPYAFLDRTPGWSREQICLGFALTEPSLTTVQAAVLEPEHLHSLAMVVERDLPTGLSAQIEMARFSVDDGRRVLDKRRAGA